MKATNKTYFFLPLLILLLINMKVSFAQSMNTNGMIVNCYILKPVMNDSKADTMRVLTYTKYSLNSFLDSTSTNPGKWIRYDSAMDFITSFENQKIILVNHFCFNELNKPDSCGLMSIYFNSGFTTKVFTKTIVHFLTSYKMNILGFGNAVIFEYRFNGVSEDEPHFMYIVLKEQTAEEKSNEDDYSGYVICSDGLEWKEYNRNTASTPIFVQMIIRGKYLFIPLYYDGFRFIPIGHFKSIK